MSKSNVTRSNCFLWFCMHTLRKQNTKLPKRITVALANTVYIKAGFRISIRLLSSFNEVPFLGVIDPKPNFSCENESVLEKELILWVLLTKPIGLLRIA